MGFHITRLSSSVNHVTLWAGCSVEILLTGINGILFVGFDQRQFPCFVSFGCWWSWSRSPSRDGWRSSLLRWRWSSWDNWLSLTGIEDGKQSDWSTDWSLFPSIKGCSSSNWLLTFWSTSFTVSNGRDFNGRPVSFRIQEWMVSWISVNRHRHWL